MNSNVGNAQTYEAGDQRTWKEENIKERFDAAQTNAHANLDSKDQRSIANRLAAAEKNELDGGKESNIHSDPLAPARAHGNEPSRGAKIDAELQAEEEEELRRKGKI